LYRFQTHFLKQIYNKIENYSAEYFKIKFLKNFLFGPTNKNSRNGTILNKFWYFLKLRFLMVVVESMEALLNGKAQYNYHT
jgi:hypothetical protein